MLKHTVGPWRIGDAGHTVFGPPNGNPSPQTIANIFYGTNSQKRDEVKANARLIQLAPEMAEALLLVLRDRDAGCLRKDTCDHIESIVSKL